MACPRGLTEVKQRFLKPRPTSKPVFLGIAVTPEMAVHDAIDKMYDCTFADPTPKSTLSYKLSYYHHHSIPTPKSWQTFDAKNFYLHLLPRLKETLLFICKYAG